MENENDPNTEAPAPEAEQPEIAPEEPAQAPQSPIEAAIEAGTVNAATLEDIDQYNQDGSLRLTEEETIRTAQAMEATERRLQGMHTGAGVDMGSILEMIQQFFGIGNTGLQDMTRNVFTALNEGLVTEAGELNGGVIEPLIADATRMAPAQPAPNAPGSAPQQDQNLMAPNMER